MTLAAGSRLGLYEIVSALGAGGMGEVYRARDTKLNRDVALKILPEAFASDPDRLARFTREAQTLAALNHPNIAAIYGIEESNHVRALVMELVDGEDLSAHIARGPMPLAEVLPIARQIADALEAAHEQGIIHRDLKPANIKLRADGMVKVLDFGLAKALGTADAATYDLNGPNVERPIRGADAANSPTITSPAMTQLGVILGTAAYMSPEQAKGRPADKRSDIWAFGCVLFEVLTGKRPFPGDDLSETLASVIKAEPQWDLVPFQVRRLLKSCLEKDPKKRLRDIGDAWRLLEDAPHDDRRHREGLRHTLWAGAAALFLFSTIALAVIHFRETRADSPMLQYTLPAPDRSRVNTFAISPDGRSLAIAATLDGRTSLWLRPLDSLSMRPLPGTDDAQTAFWSPDGRFVAFIAQGKLKKVGVNGGPAQSLANVGIGFGGTWNADGTILVQGSDGAIWRADANGGPSTPVTEGHAVLSYPFFLPDGHRFLYSITIGPDDARGVYVGTLDSKQTHRLVLDASNAAYAPPRAGSLVGHLLFVRDGTLMAQPVRPDSLAFAGEAVPIAEQVISAELSHYGPFSVSENGRLVYQTGGATSVDRQLVLFDRSGKSVGPVGHPGGILDFALSPDEKRVAIARTASTVGSSDVWLIDVDRATETRFTSHPSLNARPVWAPDGAQIAFSSSRAGRTDIYQKNSTGMSEEKALLSDDTPKTVMDWSRDGKFLLFVSQSHVFALPLTGKPVRLSSSDFTEGQPQLSPNGRWLAYVSNETGRSEIYVQPFSLGGSTMPAGKWPISSGGGTDPRWRQDGKELFFISIGNLVSASVRTADAARFDSDAPQMLFELTPLASPLRIGTFRYAVAANGKRFLIMMDPKEAARPPLTVVVNWEAAIKH